MPSQTNKSKMKRTCRVFLNDVNRDKAQTVSDFLRYCRDSTQYFVDLFWQREDFTALLADLPTVHRGRDRFRLTTRLAQALAKQAKETIRSQRKIRERKPRLRSHTITLCYHFAAVEKFEGVGFDYALRLVGSGAPRMVIPFKSTKPLNLYLAAGWEISNTVRLGNRNGRLFIDLILEKKRPAFKNEGTVVGMDSNYKAGLVFSDGQIVAEEIYLRVQQFAKRQRNTHAEIKSMLGHALKQIDWSNIKTLVIEDLKKVKHGKRRTFRRVFNRRLSHWLYRLCDGLLEQHCGERGIRLERKNPWKTSQFCRHCRKWDRRNRAGDRFLCVHCGHSENADLNAAKNLEVLGLAGVYGLGLLASC